MPKAKDEEVAEEDEEEEAAAPGATAKKKRPKKKKGGTGAGAQEAAGEEPEPAAPAPSPDAKVSDDDEEDEKQDAPAGKKKRRPKKKSGAAGADEAEEPVAVVAEPAAPAEEAAGESGEEEGEGDGAAGGAKKKKRKPKKKGVTAGKDDEAFAKWVAAALEKTANGTEQMSPKDLADSGGNFVGYNFSGPLRPWKVTPQLKMSEDIVPPDYAHHPMGVSEIERKGLTEVPVLEGERLLRMREACKLGREVLDIASRFMKVGVTGDEVDRVLYQACVDRKIYPSPLNYHRFPKSVCVSPNEVICHGIPDCRPIEEGDIVNLDVSIYHKGFHSDLNETFFIGKCDEDSHRLVRTAYNALHEAAKQIRPGTLYRDLGTYIHSEASKNGTAVVMTYCGHGVGELFHGPPKVPHYRKNKAVGIMRPGHVFTVEPMLNLGTNGGDKKWPDDWTAVTMDGKRSAQFEQTFLVTETGFEVLTARPGTNPFSMPDYDPAMFQR